MSEGQADVQSHRASMLRIDFSRIATKTRGMSRGTRDDFLVAVLDRRHGTIRCSAVSSSRRIAASACKLARSRPIVAIASVRSPRRRATAQSRVSTLPLRTFTVSSVVVDSRRSA